MANDLAETASVPASGPKMAGSGRRSGLRVLVWLWVALGATVVLALPYDPFTLRAVLRTLGIGALTAPRSAASTDVSPQLEWLKRYDPRPGSPAPAALQASAGDLAKVPRAVVYLGACSSCSLKFQLDEDLFSRASWFVPIVLVDAASDMKALRRAVGSGAKVIVDEEVRLDQPERTLAFQLNAHFSPRVYLYNHEWKLLCASEFGEDPMRFLARNRKVRP